MLRARKVSRKNHENPLLLDHENLLSYELRNHLRVIGAALARGHGYLFDRSLGLNRYIAVTNNDEKPCSALSSAGSRLPRARYSTSRDRRRLAGSEAKLRVGKISSRTRLEILALKNDTSHMAVSAAGGGGGCKRAWDRAQLLSPSPRDDAHRTRARTVDISTRSGARRRRR